MISAVIFDLDGVIRHFDPSNVADIERRHGIDPGTIEHFAFSSPLIEEVTTGVISRATWIEHIAEHIGNAEAAKAWGRQPFHVDVDVLALAGELREQGLRTAILTNGTDTVDAEVASTGIPEQFDAIFNSAEIGHVKPEARAFQHVLDALDLPASHAFFTDDSPHKLAGATALGIRTHLFRGATPLRSALRNHGIPLR